MSDRGSGLYRIDPASVCLPREDKQRVAEPGGKERVGDIVQREFLAPSVTVNKDHNETVVEQEKTSV